MMVCKCYLFLKASDFLVLTTKPNLRFSASYKLPQYHSRLTQYPGIRAVTLYSLEVLRSVCRHLIIVLSDICLLCAVGSGSPAVGLVSVF